MHGFDQRKQQAAGQEEAEVSGTHRTEVGSEPWGWGLDQHPLSRPTPTDALCSTSPN